MILKNDELTNGEISKIVKQTDWNFKNSKTTRNRNYIHPYPAKFIEELPKKIIELFPIRKEHSILDPFVGSGTTLVAAQNAGYSSIGVDLNPIATLISTVKTQSVPMDFMDIAERIVDCAKENEPKERTIEIQNVDHWFMEDVQICLQSLINQINQIEDLGISQALKLAFSSIIVKVSNQESDTRYAAIEKSINKADVYKMFLKSCEKVYDLLNENVFTAEYEATILNKNILDLEKKDIKQDIGMVITSPPYPNAYEYWLYHKFRMSWLGFNPKEVKDKEIGARAHYFKKNHQTIDDFLNQMESIFEKLSGIVASRGLIVVIVGRSKIHGIEYDNGELLKESAKNAGLEVVCDVKREISGSRKSFNLKHAKIKEETLLFLRVK